MAELAPGQESAYAVLGQALSEYGLGHLTDAVWQQYLVTNDANAVMFAMRNDPTNPLYAEFHKRFPAYKALAESGRAISPAEYVQYERSVAQLVQAYGLPAGVFDADTDITEMLLNDVSVTEAKERFDMAATAAYSAPQEFRDALQTEYGMSPGDMVAYWLDPDRAMPVLERQFSSARLMGAAAEQALQVGRQQAERMYELGITYEAGRQGFQQVAATEGLGTGPGETIGVEERVDAAFGDQAAREKQRRVQSSRVGQFEGGGNYAASAEGIAGLA
jgi:hypothetical protein